MSLPALKIPKFTVNSNMFLCSGQRRTLSFNFYNKNADRQTKMDCRSKTKTTSFGD